jgi:hypothetical protein
LEKNLFNKIKRIDNMGEKSDFEKWLESREDDDPEFPNTYKLSDGEGGCYNEDKDDSILIAELKDAFLAGQQSKQNQNLLEKGMTDEEIIKTIEKRHNIKRCDCDDCITSYKVLSEVIKLTREKYVEDLSSPLADEIKDLILLIDAFAPSLREYDEYKKAEQLLSDYKKKVA